MSDSDQAEVIAALASPAFHGLKGGAVEVIETHAGMVFLAGHRAVKIKKAVALGYLDFSTLDKREAVCRREWQLNRQNAPDIYRGVKPITRDAAGRLKLGGAGEVVEWCVLMRRFARDDMLDRLAEASAIARPLALALADAVAESHGRAPLAADESAALAPDRVVAQLALGFGRHGGLIAPAEAEALDGALERALAASRPLRLKRAGQGETRRCHGDLHLANIVLAGKKPRLFDALEFDEHLARIDVLYDLAFLLMDLEARRQRPAANLVLNRYLTVSALKAGGDPRHDAALGCLAPFAALRAGIRALVAADRSVQFGGEAGAAKAAQARAHFQRACGLMAPSPPRLVVIAGLSGTGKSTVAAALAPDLAHPAGALHLRSDIERKTMAGLDETAKLHATHYTAQASAAVYRRLYDRARTALAGGFAVIVDAVFARPAERAAIAQVAGEAGVAFHALWLTAPPAVLESRVEGRRGDASDADRQIVAMQLAYDTGEIGWPKVDASGTIAEVTAAARKALGMA
jgi:aminoglycoside phosphotransferase family enzyme/predicted kinase